MVHESAFSTRRGEMIRRPALETLREMWGAAYVIRWDGQYIGTRRDGAGVVKDPDEAMFWEKLRNDLTRCPVMAEIRIDTVQRSAGSHDGGCCCWGAQESHERPLAPGGPEASGGLPV